MRLEKSEHNFHVFLSERNLNALLTKLNGYPRDSACTLTYTTRDGELLLVTAEPNAIHYANPERDSPLPGMMHPDTEVNL